MVAGVGASVKSMPSMLMLLQVTSVLVLEVACCRVTVARGFEKSVTEVLLSQEKATFPSAGVELREVWPVAMTMMGCWVVPKSLVE